MKAKDRIAELEAELEMLQPKHVDLIKINGVPMRIVHDKDIINLVKGKRGKWMRTRAIPLIEVVERRD